MRHGAASLEVHVEDLLQTPAAAAPNPAPDLAQLAPLAPTTRCVFLLSPASLSGERARQLTSPRARFPTAERLRSDEGVPIGEAYAFLSSLYFRGKLAYARRFAASPPGIEGGIYVIAPGFGLVPPDWALTGERLRRLRRTPVDPSSRAYLRPLRVQARALAGVLGEDGRAVLLGSVATGKYVDVLGPALGPRLHFPACFAGRGDMSRGSLMLRAAASGEELAYVPLAGVVPPARRAAAAQTGDAP
jgi:hypothetical protein